MKYNLNSFIEMNIYLKNITATIFLIVMIFASSGACYSFPYIVSNAVQPAIELSPIVKATITDANKDWDISFTING
jgi:hypothetical protein